MTRFPAATWRGPVPNQGGPMGALLGLVLHIQEGSEAGTDAWFHNPASKVSAHFGNPKVGPLDQWVEVGTVAWAEVAGNTNWVSVENEGNSGDQLTPSQLENLAQLAAWLHATYGVPLQVSDSIVPGITGHGLGGAAWGGHYDCPGQPILDARPAIIFRAQQVLGVPTDPTGDSTMGNVPPTISQKWPELAGDFPPNAPYTDSGALIWGDAGARAAALYAQQARDAINALASKITIPPPPPAIDVNALARALAPLLQASPTADQVAMTVVAHLATTLGKG